MHTQGAQGVVNLVSRHNVLLLDTHTRGYFTGKFRLDNAILFRFCLQHRPAETLRKHLLEVI